MVDSNRKAAIPSQFRGEIKKFYRDVVEMYDLEPHHIRLLKLCCEALQRAETAQAVLDAQGLTYEGPSGPRLRPEVKAKEQAERNAMAMIKQLGFDVEPPGAIGRPPGR